MSNDIYLTMTSAHDANKYVKTMQRNAKSLDMYNQLVNVQSVLVKATALSADNIIYFVMQQTLHTHPVLLLQLQFTI